MLIKKKRISISDIATLKKEFALKGLNTVCQSAKCPNIGECFKNKRATFLILGKNCTRNCQFCAVEKQKPQSLDPVEPLKTAQAIKALNLSYAVITSVTRDDLQDGGAYHFAKTISAVRKICPYCKIEVLVPDFLGDVKNIDIVLKAKPDVFSHNLEMPKNFYSKLRTYSDYNRSLSVLQYAKSFNFKIKTGIMVGLGESKKEIFETVNDIKNLKTDVLTIGQYLSPSKKHYPVIKEYSDSEFEELADFAKTLGIKDVVAGRYVRSSYFPA
ncbi:MAG: lipoyl synthase [Elusimicrobiota bacterium]|jgi:lipoic acid synthetase|nr:lipoyl synthase [Elusimicrobiota bacterium]